MRMVFPEIVRASNAEPVLRETQFAAAPAHHRTREHSLLPGPRQRAGLDARSCAGLPTPPPSAVLPDKERLRANSGLSLAAPCVAYVPPSIAECDSARRPA